MDAGIETIIAEQTTLSDGNGLDRRLAILREVFTCVFPWGRIVGWIAHAKEQLATNRLLRPMPT